MEEIVWSLKKGVLEEKEWETFENSAFFKEACGFYNELQCLSKTMFGYPANRCYLSPKTQYLLLAHYVSPFSNNCGDIDERGNYAMDSKIAEKKIHLLLTAAVV